MAAPQPSPDESESIFVLTPNPSDSAVAAEVLRDAGLRPFVGASLTELCESLQSHWGVAVIAEDIMTAPGVKALQAALSLQEPWSDLPIILLTNSSIERAARWVSHLGNISLLERPFSRLTLVRAVEVALGARRRQYEVRRLLEALKRSRDDAENANASKTEFLANMSHEIRTPIGAVLGFLELMKNPANAPSENLAYVGIIERNSQQLLRLIDDILDLSKVEAGKMSVECIPFRLNDLLGDLASLMSFRAHEKGIEFHLHVDSPLPERLVSDPVRLRQILSNVLGNAIKFTENGSVEFRVRYVAPQLHFSVRDTGVGIPKEARSKIFRAFSQADTSTTRKFGGTGLGLILSKRLAESLGGGLELQDTDGERGSTFVGRVKALPVEGTAWTGLQEPLPLAAPAHGVWESQLLKGMHVLLVEDSPDNQILISTFLESSGAAVHLAGNGKEGLERALKGDYDVILMDVQMPVMDGHEATRRLRAAAYAGPIIALTAHAMPEERDRCFASGFSDFLTKPIRRDYLVASLVRYLPRACAEFLPQMRSTS